MFWGINCGTSSPEASGESGHTQNKKSPSIKMFWGINCGTSSPAFLDVKETDRFLRFYL
jgi:hypothetical protein